MIFDKKLIKSDFEKAAVSYDDHAGLQRDVAGALVDKAADYFSDDACVLDAGCGTGYVAQANKWNVLQLDLAMQMCANARAHAPVVNADMESLPIGDVCVDGVTSSLALQWATNPIKVLEEAYRVLNKGGYACYATFGPATLKELKQLFAVVDGAEHVSPFLPVDKWEMLLSRVGFEVVRTETETMQLYYPDVYGLLRSIKGVGGNNKKEDRKRYLSKTAWANLADAYKQAYACEEGIKATWEVVYLIARK